MKENRAIDQIQGKTFQWTFTDGPARNTTYEHRFGEDGTVAFRAVDKSKNGKSEQSNGQSESKARYGAAKVADDIWAVSYKGDSGYTLTTILNFETKRLVSFASNEKEWFEQHGTFEATHN